MSGTKTPVSKAKTLASKAETLALVREVAQHVNPAEPTAVSKRQFDTGRVPAGVDECPSSSNLCRRFASSWPDLLELAFRGATSVKTTAVRGRAKSAHEGGGTTRETALTALAIVAARLGVRTLRPDDYAQAREVLLTASRGERREALSDRLPTVGQFRPFGEWDELLAAAGLEGRTQERYQPPAMPVEDAIELFLTAQGYLPRRRDLRRFADERGFALQHRPMAEYDAAYQRITERRSAKGLWTPPGPALGRYKPPWAPMDAAFENGGENGSLPLRVRRDYWTLELVKHGLRLALSRLPPGQELTQPVLRRLAKTDRAIPTASVVTRVAAKHNTTFSALRDEAVISSRRRR